MAQSDFITRSSLISGRAHAQNFGASQARPRAGAADTTALKAFVYSLALIGLVVAVMIYPLCTSGGILARARGNVVAIDLNAHTVSFQENGVTLTVPVRASTQVLVNEAAVALEALEIGDRVLVRYDSALKLNALEIQALGRLPR